MLASAVAFGQFPKQFNYGIKIPNLTENINATRIPVMNDDGGILNFVLAENLVSNNLEISVLDENGIEKFTIQNEIKLKGFEFDFADKSIKAPAIVPNTIFIDTINGNDGTGQIENRSKPFKTDSAAYASLPVDDGSLWTLFFIDTGNITRTFHSEFPNRKIGIRCLSEGDFDFSNIVGSTLPTHLDIYAPDVDLIFNNPSPGQFGATNFNIVVNDIVANTTASNFEGFFVGSTGNSEPANLLKCKNITISKSAFVGFNGTLIVTETMNMDINGILIGNGGDRFNLDVNKLNKVTTGNVSLFSANGIDGNLKVKEVTGSNLGTIYLQDNYARTMVYDFSGFKNTSGVAFTLFNGVDLFADVTVKGITDENTLIDVGANESVDLKFENFKGRLSNPIDADAMNFKAFNSTFFVDGPLFNSTTAPSVTFDGVNAIIQDSPGYVFENLTAPTNFTINGSLKTNARSYGVNANPLNTTSTFKEKSGEIIIRDRIDVVNKVLDPNITYVIDGTITLFAGEYIYVPASGNLTLNGYGLEASTIVKNVSGESIFKSPLGGSGGLQINALKLKCGDCDVFTLTDATGSNAVELTKVNIEDSGSIGTLDGYRQGLWINIGLFNIENGLTLENNWLGGFKMETTIVRKLSGSTGTLFKKGSSFTMGSRFYSDANIDLPSGWKLTDFEASNFTKDNLFQLQNTIVTRNGNVDVEDSNYLGTLDHTSPKSLFKNNVGLKNTYVGGDWELTTTATTTVSAIGEFYKVSGTTTYDDLQHFASGGDNAFVYDNGNTDFFNVNGHLIVGAAPNSFIVLRLRVHRFSTNTYEDIREFGRNIDNSVDGTFMGYFNFSAKVKLNHQDRIEVWGANGTDTSDFTLRENSYLTISKRI